VRPGVVEWRGRGARARRMEGIKRRRRRRRKRRRGRRRRKIN